MSSLFTPLNIQAIKNPQGKTISEKIALLEEQKSKVRELFSKLDFALANQKITLQEYNYLLQKYAAGNHEHKLMQAIEMQISRLRENRDSYREKSNNFNSMGTVVIAIIIVLMLVLTGTTLMGKLFNTHSTITGFGTYIDKVVKQSEQLLFTENQTINFNVTNITSLKLTGSIKGLGTAKAYLLLGDEKLLITSQSNVLEEKSSLLKTDKSIYLTGEEIKVSIDGAILKSDLNNFNETLNETNSTNENNTNLTTNSSLLTYTLYAKSSEKTQILTSNNFTLEPGEYELYALINNQSSITKESTFIKVVDSMQDISKNFTAVCDSTCTLNDNKIPKEIQVEVENATLEIDEIIYTTKTENSKPVLIKEFNDITMTQGMTINLDLNEYFADADGQTLIYDYSSELSGLKITNNILNISPNSPGTFEVTIYASDAISMIESNTFKIIVVSTTSQTTENNITNTTLNSTNITNNSTNSIINTNTTNETNNQLTIKTNNANLTTNTTNLNITNLTVDELEKLGLCNNPDPNKRPASCLIQNSDYFFEEQGIHIENLDKNKVARVTPIGNFLITGDVYENSIAKPGKRDFKIGYTNDNFEFIPTLWIDSKTGDLHLAGSLHEEIINLELPRNVYSFQNRRGVNLGYANPRTGDLYIRGNLIPYRRSLE